MAYIERAYLTEQFENLLQDDNVMCPVMKVLDALEIIDTAPSADVAEVKHGKWAHIGGDEWCCTNCGEVITTEGSWEAPTKKYCNECGAKMDGERSDT